ncbi:hypothetical protein EYF80_038457 [Liparis tanakae]|uniref:Uncharacterized protein n=1 Tax=Liparis tanakae TaxID=230148 RepID=A0A4Z2GDC6_9TELE|nr:hypothetical protein EYF80_038457 [Liparis tanakae]
MSTSFGKLVLPVLVLSSPSPGLPGQCQLGPWQYQPWYSPLQLRHPRAPPTKRQSSRKSQSQSRRTQNRNRILRGAPEGPPRLRYGPNTAASSASSRQHRQRRKTSSETSYPLHSIPALRHTDLLSPSRSTNRGCPPAASGPPGRGSRSRSLQKPSHSPPAATRRERWRAERERERRTEKERRKTKEPTKTQVQPQPERRNILEDGEERRFKGGRDGMMRS